MGYDESLGDEISITIIATGFEQKSPFGEQPKEEVKQEEKDERIMFTLDISPKAQLEPLAIVAPEPEVEQVETIFKDEVVLETPVVFELTPADLVEEPTMILVDENVKELIAEEEQVVVELTDETPLVFELDLETGVDPVKLNFEEIVVAPIMEKEMIAPKAISLVSQTPLAQGFLVKPAQIYVSETTPIQQVQEQKTEIHNQVPVQIVQPLVEMPKSESEAEDLIELVFREATITEEPVLLKEEVIVNEIEEPAHFDEAEAQRTRAAERLYKLRNLSFNFNSQDPNNEYESIPAYVRHNLQVHNTTLASVEKFYSSYSVGKDENNITQISTINTFLEGKKPD